MLLGCEMPISISSLSVRGAVQFSCCTRQYWRVPGMYPGEDASGDTVELFVSVGPHRSHFRCSSQKKLILCLAAACHVNRTAPFAYQFLSVPGWSKSGSYVHAFGFPAFLFTQILATYESS